jgi:hypothetical protein
MDARVSDHWPLHSPAARERKAQGRSGFYVPTAEHEQNNSVSGVVCEQYSRCPAAAFNFIRHQPTARVSVARHLSSIADELRLFGLGIGVCSLREK